MADTFRKTLQEALGSGISSIVLGCLVLLISSISGFSLSSTYEELRNGDCTSCEVIQDKSAYWTPSLYFKHANGSYELVPQDGGLLA